MANPSDVTETCSKLKDMTLTGNFNESQSNGKLLHLSPSQTSDSDLEASDNCNEFTFENVIGHLEDMLIDDDFSKLQNSFLEKYWEEFENSEENKHSYIPIFNEYTNQIENFIVQYLKQRILNFDMEVFATELEKRKDNLEGEIFEVLLTLTDFTAFKEIFLDYRAMKEGHTLDLSASLCVSSVTY